MPKIVKIKKIVLGVSMLICILAVVLPGIAFAQSTRNMKRRGDAAFRGKNYYGAAKWYAAVLYDSPLVTTIPARIYPFQPGNYKRTRKIKPTVKSELQFRLAESYRLYGHFKEALPQYEQYLASQDTRYPLARLWYAETLLANDQPEKASTVFKAFLQKYRHTDSISQKAKQGLANCDFTISQKKKAPRAVITKLTSLTSTDGSNFGMEKIPDGSFLFTSSRHELQGKKKEKVYPVRLYTVDLKTGSIPAPVEIPGKFNMGASSMLADGLSLYFTGWKDDPATIQPQYQLYITHRSGIADKWSEPVALASNVNVKGFQSKQPFVTRDGRFLLFSSNRPGGYGSYDIWMVPLKEGKPDGDAINLGNTVNTSEADVSPFYDAATGRLFLSSDGRVGMGGMDIYAVNGDINSNQWKDVSNLGSPVNSVKDDLYYTKDIQSDTIYLSSDRASSCCMEIFSAVQLPVIDSIPKKDLVKESVRLTADTPVAVKDLQKQLIDSISAVTVDRLHVNYRFASARIRRADYPQLEQVITQLKNNPALNLLVASFTDCIGSKSANELLSRKRSAAVKAYLVSKGIDASRINIDFFGEKHLIVACKEDRSYDKESQIANRRSDLVVTAEKNPKWTPTGRELDLMPVAAITENVKENKVINHQVNIPAAVTTNTPEMKQPAFADAGKIKAAIKTTAPSGTRYRKPSAITGDDTNVSAFKGKTAGITSQKTDNAGKSRKDSVVRPMARILDTAGMAKSNVTKDSIRTMNITALLDLAPRLKKPFVIEQMTSRIPKKSFEVLTTSDSVKIELYDNGVFDHDSVSVIYNKELVIYKQLLQTNKPIVFYVKLNADLRRNEMIFFAENLGFTPPNSALMIITDGEKKRTEVNVTSDLEHNSVIYFIKVKK